MTQVKILYEDKEIFVVVKPPGMPSQQERSPAMDMVSYLKNLLVARDKVKNPYIAVVHRLDKPVGGVMVYGKTPAAAGDLSRQIAQKTAEKNYMAVVHGLMEAQEGTMEDLLIRDKKTNTSQVVSKKIKPVPGDAKKAVLSYQVIKTAQKDSESYSLVKVRLETGRHHQIRVQMSHAGHPLAGDRRYGMAGDGFFQIGLFSSALSFDHPADGRRVTFTAEPDAQPFLMFL